MGLRSCLPRQALTILDLPRGAWSMLTSDYLMAAFVGKRKEGHLLWGSVDASHLIATSSSTRLAGVVLADTSGLLLIQTSVRVILEDRPLSRWKKTFLQSRGAK